MLVVLTRTAGGHLEAETLIDVPGQVLRLLISQAVELCRSCCIQRLPLPLCSKPNTFQIQTQTTSQNA